ncbi:MAG: SRPBCC domain-containing protein [Actinomycetales bacterium]
MGTTTYTIEPGSHALHLEREFDAPAETLLRAHTDPELLAQWVGPRRLQTKVEHLEARDGGRWRFGQWGEDGVEHWFHGVFHGDPSVEHGIHQTFEYEGTPGEVLLERLTFEEHDGRTLLRATSVFTSVEARDGMVAAGMQEGAEDGYARLDELLERVAG